MCSTSRCRSHITNAVAFSLFNPRFQNRKNKELIKLDRNKAVAGILFVGQDDDDKDKKKAMQFLAVEMNEVITKAWKDISEHQSAVGSLTLRRN